MVHWWFFKEYIPEKGIKEDSLKNHTHTEAESITEQWISSSW